MSAAGATATHDDSSDNAETEQQLDEPQQHPSPQDTVMMALPLSVRQAYREMQESLQCPQCRQLLDDPIPVSPCQHSYCRSCLQALRRPLFGVSFDCRVCQVEIQLPPSNNDGTNDGNKKNDIDTIPTNSSLREAVRHFQAIKPMLKEAFVVTNNVASAN